MNDQTGKYHHIKLFFTLLSVFLITSTYFASIQANDEDLIFSTYIGGELADRSTGMVVDAQGNSYITGVTQSVEFPTLSSIQAPTHGLDAFVAKISPDGQELLYILWFNAINASDVDEGLGITVDAQGHAYVTGHTRSPDFCSFYGQVPGFQTNYAGDGDAFLFKVQLDGTGLVYCTFIGGSDWDSGSAVIVDGAGNATITGGTWSGDFPTTDNAASKENSGQRDVFLTTLDADGTQLRYSSYFGGNGQEHGRDLAAVGTERIAVTGWTNSINFPTKQGGYDSSYGGFFDAFLAQIDLNSGAQTYGSFLGGDGEDRASAIAVTSDEQIIITGNLFATTAAPNPTFPTSAGALKTELSGESDAFLVKFNEGASGLAYSTLIGGEDQELALGLSVNLWDEIGISGSTTSADFPTTGQAYQLKYKGVDNAPDAFLTLFDPSGSNLIYSSYFGGDLEDSSSALYLSGADEVFLTGSTRSENLPTSDMAFSSKNQGDFDIYVTRLSLSQPVTYRAYSPLVLIE